MVESEKPAILNLSIKLHWKKSGKGEAGREPETVGRSEPWFDFFAAAQHLNTTRCSVFPVKAVRI